ncbi:hypothetical protein [Catenovulum maritimum]|uniref:Uncharacterized protein n=1 Tax=Catenovulum maritimum TaxID=1513271 RepID=A0A0J8GTQ1_9ALTE|nr:hypothetical protein [Catenovulum maritimum]KMT66117.1 hypothetical protein XM47_04895 [Catenovulum maritimum]
MPKINTIIFLVAFVVISYKIIQPLLVEDTEKTEGKEKKNSAHSKHISEEQRALNERLAEKMPKLYSWQRLLQLHQSNSDQVFSSYLEEWVVESPATLINKAFQRNELKNNLNLLQIEVVQHLVKQYKNYTLELIAEQIGDGVIDKIYDEVLFSIYLHHPAELPKYISLAQLESDQAKKLFKRILDQDLNAAKSWFESETLFSTSDNYKLLLSEHLAAK